ncbi:MAG: cytochrome c-type biogenesis protein CcmH [Acidimicrobiales bacterium]|nr:cytochrome c-type biogenesis protein CcmH [Acidimicrobiales bacterium]MCB9373074.1 cytochrome c-type biogenesis protein CcmH [Microthrixaceae bacterium]
MSPPPSEAAPSGGGGPKAWVWAVMAAVVLVALVVGTRPDDTPRTNEERAHALADTLKCPTCRSQSVADSDAPVSKEIRTEINRRIEAGETDEAIRDYLVGRFGEDVVLTPAASGVTGLVWVLPVVLLVAGAFGLAVAFRRWRRRSPMAVTDDDRALVEQARRAAGDGHRP